MNRHHRLLICILFFITGAFGLVYEVIWARYLALLIGVTAYAHCAVLTTFMGGLALGALIFGPISDRIKNGFKAYGMIEALIGIYGLLFPRLFHLIEQTTQPLTGLAQPGTIYFLAAKMLMSVACILVPSVLMGGTLPILTRYLTSTESALRRSITLLYALNSGGAVIGSLLAEFLFVGTYGLSGTMMLIGTANMILGLFAILAGRYFPERSTAVRESTDIQDQPDLQDTHSYSKAQVSAAVLIAGLSGLASMSLEVAWIRYFSLMLGSSNYAFAVVLAAFISGIAIGSLWFHSPARARTPLLPLLGKALLATAFFIALSLLLYGRVPFWLWKIKLFFRPIEQSFFYYQVCIYLFCFGLMFLPTMVAGVVFPAAVRIAAKRSAIGGRLGRVYAVNTIGTLLGVLLTTLLLFKLIGLFNIFRMILVLYALAAIGLIWLIGLRRMRIWLALAVALLGLHITFYRNPDPLLINMGLFMMHLDPDTSFADFKEETLQDNELLYHGEGAYGTVTVRNFRDKKLCLAIDGKVDASSGMDMKTQVLLGSLPLFFIENPQEVFVVGLGSGVTAGSALAHDVRVDMAEISPEVVKAEELFREFNHAPLQDPRLTLYVDDARSVLQYCDKRYDAIISEPSNPWLSGMSGLFTADFYGLVKQRLSEGGIFCQWVPAYMTNDDTLHMIISTLMYSFDYVTIFESLPGDNIFLASDRPIRIDQQELERKMNSPRVLQDLSRIDADSIPVLLAMQLKEPMALRRDVLQGPVHTDDLPLLERWAQLGAFVKGGIEIFERIDDRGHECPKLLLSEYLRTHVLSTHDVRKMMLYLDVHPPIRAAALVRSIQRRGFEDPRLFAYYMKYIFGSDMAYGLLNERKTPEEWEAVSPEEIPGILAVQATYYRQSYWFWCPPDHELLLQLADSILQSDNNPVVYHMSLLRAFCELGPAEACFEQAGVIDRLSHFHGTPPNWPQAGYERQFEAALRIWDLDRAAGLIKQMRDSNACDQSRNCEKMQYLLDNARDVHRFYVSLEQ